MLLLDGPTCSELGTRLARGRWLMNDDAAGAQRQDLSVNLSENSRIFGIFFSSIFIDFTLEARHFVIALKLIADAV